MRKIKVLGALIAVLAFSALTVASASATLWLENGQSVNAETMKDSTGTLLLHHTGGLAGNVTVECHGVFHGTIGPGPLDLITDVLGLNGELNLITCIDPERGNCYKAVNELVLVDALNLPWHTLLVLSGTTTLDHFLNEAGKVPKWDFTCNIITLKGSCEGLDLATFSKNTATGSVFEYEKSSEASCSDGGKGTTLGLGEVAGAQVS